MSFKSLNGMIEIQFSIQIDLNFKTSTMSHDDRVEGH